MPRLAGRLFGVARRPRALKDKIDQASFEGRRLAVRQLVKGIEVRTNTIDGKRIPHVSITYHFQDLGLPDVSPFGLFTYGDDRTGEPAATSRPTSLRPAPAARDSTARCSV